MCCLEETREDKEELTSDDTPLAIGTRDKTKLDVYTVIYKLYMVAPSILTTVIRNVTTHLSNPYVVKRLQVTKLLEWLFYSPAGNIMETVLF